MSSPSRNGAPTPQNFSSPSRKAVKKGAPTPQHTPTCQQRVRRQKDDTHDTPKQFKSYAQRKTAQDSGGSFAVSALTNQGSEYAELFHSDVSSKERGRQLVKEDRTSSKKDGKKKKKKFGM